MFVETPRFPEDISLGVSGGAEFSTDVSSNSGGFIFANRNRTLPLQRIEASYGIRTIEQFKQLQSLMRVVCGKWGGFRFKDWFDFQFTHDDGFLDFMSPGVYQLTKRYNYGAYFADRPIKKPVLGSVKIERNGVAVAEGSAAGNCLIDSTTGLVTFVADALTYVTAITTGIQTVVTVGAGIGTRGELSLSGIQGVDAALLENQTFTVVSQTSTTYTLQVNTTGKNVFSDAGTRAYAYPTSSESLTAAGEFDIPMKFDTDIMQASIVSKKGNGENLYSWGQIPLVEWRNPS